MQDQGSNGSSIASSQSQNNSSGGPQPSMTKLEASYITSNSAILSWLDKSATNYIIQYGTNPKSLSTTQTYFNSAGTVSVTLKNLPGGKKIYVSITPYDNGVAGTPQQVAFTTKQQNLIVPIIVTILSLGAIAGFAMFIIRRARANAELQEQATNIVDDAAIFPEENPNDYYKRVNWWQGDAQHPPQPPSQKKQDEYPDMFEEGNKRLDDEERDRKI